MLIIYTPDQQDRHVEDWYIKVRKDRFDGLLQVYQVGASFVLKIPWCREVATGALKDVFIEAPPGIANIYGIRKHGTHVQHQPSNCPGKINQSSKYTDKIFTDLFQLMVEVISCVLDGVIMSPERAKSWSYKWYSLSANTKYPVLGISACPTIRCILNSDIDNVPELDIDDLWSKDKMFGTITGIPVHWLSCAPVMSYLLYLPRLWGAFYSTPRMLPKLSQMSGRARILSSVIKDIIKINNREVNITSGAHLWLGLAYKLILPLWFTSCGKEFFWTFTYLLIGGAFGGAFSVENLAESLYLPKHCGGFQSWCTWYGTQELTPKWFNNMRRELAMMGPSALVRFGNIASYI